MRKTLLTMLLVVLVTVASVAQQSNSVKITNNVVRQAISRTDVMAKHADMTDVDQSISQTTGQNVSHKVAAAGAVKIGTAPHILTVLSERVSSFDSDPGLNTIAFVHRNSDPGADNTTYSSSQFRFDISTDGGETFTSNIGPLNPNTPGGSVTGVPNAQGRYPQGLIYSPDGTIDNSSIIYAGATHDGVSGNVWDGFVAGATNFDGTQITETNYLFPDGGVPTSMVEGLPGEFWSVDVFADDALINGDLVLYKGVWNGSDVDWGSTLIPGSTFQQDADGSIVTNPVIDFSDDGMTGYLLVSGGLAGDTENISYTPIFWITDDGGANWTGPHTMNLDKLGGYADTFALNHNGNIDLLPGEQFAGPLTLTFTGTDIVVDANGDMHVGCLLQPTFFEDDDFLPFNFAGGGNFVADLHYDRTGNTWNMIWPDFNTAGLAQIEKYNDSIAGIYSSAVRLHLSTDASREKVFISWGDDEDQLGAGEGKMHRDMFAFGYDINTNKTTDVRNMTSDNEDWYGKAFYLSVAPRALGGDGVYTLPTVFAEVLNPNEDLSPIDFWYYQEATFEEGDFAFDIAVPTTGAVAYAGELPVIGEIDGQEVVEPYDYAFSLPDADVSSLRDQEVTWYFGDGSAPEVSNVNVPIGHTFPDGSFLVTVCGDNEDGFVCTTISISTIIDEAAPEVSVSYDGETYGDGDEITVAGGELADILTIIVTDEIDANPSSSITDNGGYVSGVPGSYDVTITGTDASGNSTDITVTIVVEDTEAPSITISDGTDTFEDGSTVTIEGGYDVAFEDVFTITATDDSGDITPDYDASEVDFTKEGDYDLVITATDAAGNETTSTVTVSVVDTTNPVLDVATDEVNFDCDEEAFEIAADDFDSLLTLSDNFIEDGADLGDYVEYSGNIGTDIGTYPVVYTATDDADNESNPVTIDFIVSDDCTGIEDVALAAAITVTPNPSTGLFFVTVEDSYNQVDITVVDVQGKEILRSTAVTGSIKLDLTDVATGVYFVQVSTENAVAVKKVIVE